jgi:hypothetical protein
MKPSWIDAQKHFPSVCPSLSPAHKIAELNMKYTLAPSVERDEMIRQNLARRWKKSSAWVS